MTTGQLPLPVGLRPRPLLETFVAGPNGLLLEGLAALLDRGEPSYLYLSGAAGSGRTHLLLGALHAAGQRDLQTAYLPLAETAALPPDVVAGAEHADLVAIDDLQAITGQRPWEEALFHLFNRLKARDSRLLVSADRGPLQLPCALDDLKSRLASGVSYHLQPLADDDRQQLMIRQARERGFDLTADAARWMLQRCTRDAVTLSALLDRLDTASLSAQRRLTLTFVRSQLAGDGAADQGP